MRRRRSSQDRRSFALLVFIAPGGVHTKRVRRRRQTRQVGGVGRNCTPLYTVYRLLRDGYDVPVWSGRPVERTTRMKLGVCRFGACGFGACGTLRRVLALIWHAPVRGQGTLAPLKCAPSSRWRQSHARTIVRHALVECGVELPHVARKPVGSFRTKVRRIRCDHEQAIGPVSGGSHESR